MKSLTSRLTVWYALIVTLTVGILLFAGRFYLEHNLIAGIDLLNEVEFEEIRSRLDSMEPDTAEAELIRGIREHAELDAALYFFQVARRDGTVIYTSSNLGPHHLPAEVHHQERITVFDDELGLIRSMEFDVNGLDVHIASSLHNAQALFSDYNRTGIFVCFGVFGLSLILGYFLSRLAIRPIAAIQESAKRVTATSFGERIPVPNTGDEIARMASLLNAMLDRLESSFQQVKRFTAEASHEFRTPLSIIRLQTERLLGNPDLALEEREMALSDQMEEVERLSKMIDDLLLLAKADAGVMHLDLETVRLADYYQDLSADAQLIGAEKGVNFHLEADATETWAFDPRWMRHVFLNLFSNALEFSQAGDRIECISKRVEDNLCLQIRDMGPGLAEENLVRMFHRFERFEKPSGSEGNGLGLAICMSIVERHGGTIRAMNREDRSGLIVEVRLPQG